MPCLGVQITAKEQNYTRTVHRNSNPQNIETQRIIGDLSMLDLLHQISLTSDLLVKSEEKAYAAPELSKLRQVSKRVCRVKENNNYS